MSVIYGANGTENVQNSTPGLTQNNILGKEDFLKMLIAQMSNQDPLNPTEGTEFSAQLAQFSSLEQMQNMNETLKQSLDANYLLTTSINNTMSSAVIGKNVKAFGDQVNLVAGQGAEVHFNLSANAQAVKVEILDNDGKVIRTIPQENQAAGDKMVSWDGKDDNGEVMPDGSYQFRVSATDNDGDSVSAQTYTTGTIDGVRFSQNGAVLMIGNIEVQMSDVYEILNS